MSILGNIIWFLTGGFIAGLGWLVLGCLWCITIIGIPIGIQCFKFAGLSFFPFGKHVEYDDGLGSIILNIFWVLLVGIEMSLFHLIIGAILCCTVIGIPFGLQHFKIAKLAFLPFGTGVF
jgi:uncharacterized membrane protein YccF (DUF307 family)